jgi:predicted secreted hydrolase
MPATGTVRVGNERFMVTGAAWMDREWSTSSLGRDQVGWDWFSLQLSDGSDLMLYRLRKKDGSADPSSSGTLIGPAGESRPLKLSDFEIENAGEWRSPRSGARYPARWRLRIPSEEVDLTVQPVLADQELDVSFRYWEGAVDVEGTGEWRSPRSGARYPERWRLRIPSEELDLTVQPVLADQELDVSFRYWEGAVDVEGAHRGRPVRGRGYVELTGYTETAFPR